MGRSNLSLYFTVKRLAKIISRAAAEQGFAAAQNNLAFLPFMGRGVPLDFEQAATRRAADQRQTKDTLGAKTTWVTSTNKEREFRLI